MSASKYLALITGGSQGFGRAFASKLLSNGGRVAILDIDQAEGSEVVADYHNKYGKNSAHFYQCDVTDLEQLQDGFLQAKDALGGLNVVCNNAGVATAFDRTKQNFDTVSSLISLNLTAVINGTHLAVKHMSALKGGNGGVVVNTASLAGLVPAPFAPEYAATKHGVVGFTRSLKGILAKDKVRVNCICPEFVATRLVLDGMKESPSLKAFIDNHGMVPIERVTEAFWGLVLDGNKDGDSILITQAQGTRHVQLAIKFLDEDNRSTS